MAARASVPEVSTGTTMVGSTTVSSSGSTGSERVSLMKITSREYYLITRFKRREPRFVPGFVRPERTVAMAGLTRPFAPEAGLGTGPAQGAGGAQTPACTS